MGSKMKRSKKDRVIAGVCGGIAEYLNIDSTIVRLGFALSTLVSVGIFAYIVCVIIMPKDEGYAPDNFFDDEHFKEYDSDKDFSQVMGDGEDSEYQKSKNSSTFLGVSFVLLGVIFLIKQFIHLEFEVVISMFLVVMGLIIVYRNGRK